MIFGSQILLLKRLNEVAGQGQSRDAVEEHFRAVQAMFGDSLGDWSLDGYVQFLFGRNLIAFQDGRYHVSNLGKEYLVWLTREGRSESEPL